MKLRESGGLKLFVGILDSRTSADAELHDCVIDSIRNFAYDNTSLMVFQNEGGFYMEHEILFCGQLIEGAFLAIQFC
jgi:hypothetical protein